MKKDSLIVRIPSPTIPKDSPVKLAALRSDLNREKAPRRLVLSRLPRPRPMRMMMRLAMTANPKPKTVAMTRIKNQTVLAKVIRKRKVVQRSLTTLKKVRQVKILKKLNQSPLKEILRKAPLRAQSPRSHPSRLRENRGHPRVPRRASLKEMMRPVAPKERESGSSLPKNACERREKNLMMPNVATPVRSNRRHLRSSRRPELS